MAKLLDHGFDECRATSFSFTLLTNTSQFEKCDRLKSLIQINSFFFAIVE